MLLLRRGEAMWLQIPEWATTKTLLVIGPAGHTNTGRTFVISLCINIIELTGVLPLCQGSGESATDTDDR